jgi:hypothetical protein
MNEEIRNLQQQLHNALREQNPQWIEPDGESPMCRSYERRLAEMLALFARSGTGSGRIQSQ